MTLYVYTVYICPMTRTRKLIDLPDEVLKKLRILAALNESNAKAYIENLVINHVRKTKIR